MTVSEACAAYLRELEARNIRKTTRKCYRSMFRQLQTFAEAEKIESLEGFDRDALRRWRSQWTWAHSTQGRVLAQLNAFFRFAQGEGWIAASPARGIRRPNSDARPTIPLSRDEVRALLVATMRKPREQAMLLLLRYSGLAIRDAAALSRDALHPNGDLVLRRAKSGELVTVALPWEVAAAAGVEGFHPHRLRDTFAVELLLAGVLIQDVSILLGHSSVATTERYYAPWNLAQRERLGHIVREVHQRDPILLELRLRKPAGAAATAPAEAGLATAQVSRPIQSAWFHDTT
ncbi:MAG: tyrosine-type recombinase/integrase [Bryobacterales bacterium]|nr:tyrosine-type recombinase/integrase [Bryobacterales bacterium]